MTNLTRRTMLTFTGAAAAVAVTSVLGSSPAPAEEVSLNELQLYLAFLEREQDEVQRLLLRRGVREKQLLNHSMTALAWARWAAKGPAPQPDARARFCLEHSGIKRFLDKENRNYWAVTDWDALPERVI